MNGQNPFSGLSGYELRHLIGHLAESNRADDVHRLLALETEDERNGWFEARYGHGDIAGYLTDVHRARGLAERASDCSALSEEVRYALVLASVNSAMSGAPASLVESLVAAGVWSLDQATELARRNVDWLDQLRAFSALVPLLADAGRDSELAEAVAHVRGRAGKYRSRTYVSIREAGEMYAEQDLPTVSDEFERSRAIIRMAPVLGAAVLEAARSVRLAPFRVEAVAAAAQFLPERQRAAVLREALRDATQPDQDPLFRAIALASLVPPLTGRLRSKAFRWALRAGHDAMAYLDTRLHHPYDGILTVKPAALVTKESCLPFEMLARQATEPEVRHALRWARSFSPSDLGRYAIEAAFLPRLAALGSARVAEAKTLGIPVRFFRAPALARIAVYLPEADQAVRLRQAFDEAVDIPQPDHRAYVLSLMTEHMPNGLRERAVSIVLDDIEKVRMGAFTADILDAMATSFTPAETERALRLVLDGHELHRHRALRGLGPVLSRAQLRMVLRQTEPSIDKRKLARLHRKLQAASGPRATTQRILTAETAAVLVEAVRDRMGRGSDSAYCLKLLGPCLPASCIGQARDIARGIVVEGWGDRAVASLAALPQAEDYPGCLAEGLEAAMRIRNRTWAAAEIAALAPYLPDLPPREAHRVWAAALRRLGGDYLWPMLEHLETCAPIISVLGGDDIATRIESVTRQVSRWWGTDSTSTDDDEPDDADYVDVDDSAISTFARRLVEDGHTTALAALTDLVWRRIDPLPTGTADRLVYTALATELAATGHPDHTVERIRTLGTHYSEE